MSDLSDRWAPVAVAVNARLTERGWEQADLVRRSGLSDATVRQFMRAEFRGEPRPKTVAKLAEGLGWTRDSIERILEGDEPTELDGDGADRPDADDITTLVVELRDALEEARQRDAAMTYLTEIVTESSHQLAEVLEMLRLHSDQLDAIASFVRWREAALRRGGAAR